jgi:cytosine deaminase
LVIDGQIVGRGHNRRVQKGSAILHAEMDAIENAGRLKASDYRRAVLYSILSPCDMCSGTALLYPCRACVACWATWPQSAAARCVGVAAPPRSSE